MSLSSSVSEIFITQVISFTDSCTFILILFGLLAVIDAYCLFTLFSVLVATFATFISLFMLRGQWFIVLMTILWILIFIQFSLVEFHLILSPKTILSVTLLLFETMKCLAFALFIDIILCVKIMKNSLVIIQCSIKTIW